jgi:hypothetical protein
VGAVRSPAAAVVAIAAAVAVAVALPMAVVTGAAAPAHAGLAAGPDTPVVLAGIRPGPRHFTCPTAGRAELVIDYFEGLQVVPSTPYTARRAVVRFLHPSAPMDWWGDLRYERRQVPVPDYEDDPAEYRRSVALFVGMKPGTDRVKVKIRVAGVEHKGERRWFVVGATSCRR